ncbi:hypothetical protein [Marinitenerispora sediminis]|uniref:Uncharacterized protein n=1 Tax=Marinitenerispora sediminis TaxID=1931232 RepID=A0A368TAH3_9ACTN|nr:hypothetical protein [Marinitenerispora sediminis]RCV55907.1 hypothetical protein DEF28_05015 [Marinitenerispora sediminis]RCV61969.1 hypothetical protein DEF24_02725 [Marinitenerispora sediminis]RCV62037.1 hypothetical protein DEF23_00765 [Marinitenerispora sediminis]
MTFPKHARPAAPPLARSAERRHLSELAAALTPYGVWARVIEDGAPFLRVSNPTSSCATEDVSCERRDQHYAFVTTFCLQLGTSDDVPRAARRTAWLVGAADR